MLQDALLVNEYHLSNVDCQENYTSNQTTYTVTMPHFNLAENGEAYSANLVETNILSTIGTGNNPFEVGSDECGFL